MSQRSISPESNRALRANGRFRNVALHPGGEDFGHPAIVLGVENVLHAPEIEGVVPVEDGPDEATQVLAAVGVGVFADAGGEVLQRRFGGPLSGGTLVELDLGQE